MNFLLYLIQIVFLRKKLGSLLVAENGLADNDFEKNFDLLVEYCFATYDKGNKGYLTEEEFGKKMNIINEESIKFLNTLIISIFF